MNWASTTSWHNKSNTCWNKSLKVFTIICKSRKIILIWNLCKNCSVVHSHKSSIMDFLHNSLRNTCNGRSRSLISCKCVELRNKCIITSYSWFTKTSNVRNNFINTCFCKSCTFKYIFNASCVLECIVNCSHNIKSRFVSNLYTYLILKCVLIRHVTKSSFSVIYSITTRDSSCCNWNTFLSDYWEFYILTKSLFICWKICKICNLNFTRFIVSNGRSYSICLFVSISFL